MASTAGEPGVGGRIGAGASKCPACGHPSFTVLLEGSDRLYRTTRKTFQVVQCDACRLIRLHPQPPPQELIHYYPRTYWYIPGEDAASRLEEWYRRFVLRDHVHFVERALAKSKARGFVLDVGCGGGLFLRLLKDRGWEVVGLEYSLAAAAAAWSYHGVPTVCASLARPPFPRESCAAITMFHVLEHLYDPPCYLRAAHELLHPDGRLIVQVPNAASWQFLLFGEHWTGLDIPRHMYDFRDRDVEILLDRCGFQVVRTKYFSLRDNPAGFASSLVPSLDPMARRVRAVPEGPWKRLLKDAIYFAIVLAAIPFTLLEAACRAGSTVMMEAVKRG